MLPITGSQFLTLLATEGKVLAVPAETRDVVLLATEIIAELKIKLAATHALIAGLGDNEAASEQTHGQFIYGLIHLAHINYTVLGPAFLTQEKSAGHL